MQIGRQQMEALEAAVRDRFVEETRAYLERIVPEMGLRGTTAQLRSAIRSAIDECREFGIDERYDLERYLGIIFELGYFSDPQRIEWAKDFLTDPSIASPDKVNRLEGEAILRHRIKR